MESAVGRIKKNALNQWAIGNEQWAIGNGQRAEGGGSHQLPVTGFLERQNTGSRLQ